MKNIVIYNPLNGSISRLAHCQDEDAELQARPDEVFVIVEELPPIVDYKIQHYVDNGEVLPRPECPVTLAGNVLSNVVIPSAMWINGTAYALTEDTVTLDFTNPGKYKIQIESWPYRTGEFEITI